MRKGFWEGPGRYVVLGLIVVIAAAAGGYARAKGAWGSQPTPQKKAGWTWDKLKSASSSTNALS